MKTLILLLSIFSLAIITGCSNSTDVTNNNNIISTRSVNDTLSISSVTTNYSTTQDIELFFSVDTVKLSLGVTGYGSGSGNFKIYEDSTVVYSKDLGSNIQAVQQIIISRPTKANITFSNYKGTTAILLTR